MPLAFMGLGVQELVIILVIILLLFGGSRLAGLGKSSGRALKEFKEETRGLRDSDKNADTTTSSTATPIATPPAVTNGQSGPASPYQQQPNNLADPATSDVRKDV